MPEFAEHLHSRPRIPRTRSRWIELQRQQRDFLSTEINRMLEETSRLEHSIARAERGIARLESLGVQFGNELQAIIDADRGDPGLEARQNGESQVRLDELKSNLSLTVELIAEEQREISEAEHRIRDMALAVVPHATKIRIYDCIIAELERQESP